MKLEFNNSYNNYDKWEEYFKENSKKQKELLTILDEKECRLSNEEINLISSSIKMFQQGERSNGKNLRDKADKFSKEEDCNMVDAIVLFIKEENNHSAFLTKIMYKNSIDIKSSKLDSIFRRVRHILNLRCSLNVLLTAEIIAITYYSCLKKSTNSKELKRVCDKMLSDETVHLQFQAYNNSVLNTNNKKGSRRIRRIFLSGSATVLYCSQKKFFKHNNINLKQIKKESLGTLTQIIELEEKLSNR